MSTKNSNDTIGNRTRDLPTYRAVPQPTALPRALAHGNPCFPLHAVNWTNSCIVQECGSIYCKQQSCWEQSAINRNTDNSSGFMSKYSAMCPWSARYLYTGKETANCQCLVSVSFFEGSKLIHKGTKKKKKGSGMAIRINKEILPPSLHHSSTVTWVRERNT